MLMNSAVALALCVAPAMPAYAEGARANVTAAPAKSPSDARTAKKRAVAPRSASLADALRMPMQIAAAASGTERTEGFDRFVPRDGQDWARLLLSSQAVGAEIAGPLAATRRALVAEATSAVRAAPATFPYMSVVGPDRTEQPWMSQRPQLDGTYSSDEVKEFNANWGNLAMGQATALNATTRPDGTALPGKGIIGRGVTVAVIDTGIDAAFANPNDPSAGFSTIHPEFLGRIDPRSRLALANGTLTTQIMDDLTGESTGHGTHVAGTIGAAMDGVGMMGIAPGATILAVKALSSNFETDPTVAIAYVNTLPDVKIINGSFGPIIPPGSTIWQTGNIAPQLQVVRESLTQGKILVIAAGNDGEDSPIQAVNPSGIGLYPYITPRNAQTGVYNDGGQNYDFSGADRLPGKILVVVNLGIDLTIAPGSNRCGVAAFWCVAAPGGGNDGNTNNGIFSSWPRAADEVTMTAPNGATYASLNGTSMAAPHVSGALAVLMEAYPTYSARVLTNLMFSTAEDLGAPGIDVVYGHGLIRLDRALTPSPALPVDGVVQVSGERQFWTSPVTSNGTLTVDNAVAPAAAGELVIAGEASFAAVNVQTGLLTVDGALAAPTITVGANGVLQGMGDLYGNVTVHGRFGPDGAMFAYGNVTIASDGTFRTNIDGRAEIHGPGGYDTLMVSGSGNYFTAGGTYAARFRGIEKSATNTFLPAIGDRFLVVEAIDGARVRGHFDTVTVWADGNNETGLPAASRLDVLYYANQVVSAITPASFAGLAANGIALTPRQGAVGGALDQARPAPGAAMSPAQLQVFDLVFALTAPEMPAVFDQISGPGYGSASAAALGQAMQFGNAIQQRLDAVRGGVGAAQSAVSPLLSFSNDRRMEFATSLPGVMAYASADPTAARRADAGWAVWGQAVGATARVGSDGSGFSSSTRGGGIALGADKVVDPNLVVGIAGMYASAVTTTDGGVRSTADTYAAAIYGAWTRGGWELDSQIGLGKTELSSRRNFTVGATSFTATGGTSGWNLMASSELGYRLPMTLAGQSGFVKPLVGVTYGDFRRNPFTEVGAGGFNLTVMGDTPTRVMSKLGFAAGFDLRHSHGILRPELRLAWGHDFADTAPSVQSSLLGASFVTTDSRPARDAALVGLQIAAIGNGAWQMFGGYTGDFRANAMTHAGNIGVRVRW